MIILVQLCVYLHYIHHTTAGVIVTADATVTAVAVIIINSTKREAKQK